MQKLARSRCAVQWKKTAHLDGPGPVSQASVQRVPQTAPVYSHERLLSGQPPERWCPAETIVLGDPESRLSRIRCQADQRRPFHSKRAIAERCGRPLSSMSQWSNLKLTGRVARLCVSAMAEGGVVIPKSVCTWFEVTSLQVLTYTNTRVGSSVDLSAWGLVRLKIEEVSRKETYLTSR